MKLFHSTKEVSLSICQSYFQQNFLRENFDSIPPFTHIAFQRTITDHRPGGLKVISRSGCLVGGTNLRRYSVSIEEEKNEGRMDKEEGKTDGKAKGQRGSISVKEI